LYNVARNVYFVLVPYKSIIPYQKDFSTYLTAVRARKD
jgi:hypothetical protein